MKHLFRLAAGSLAAAVVISGLGSGVAWSADGAQPSASSNTKVSENLPVKITFDEPNGPEALDSKAYVKVRRIDFEGIPEKSIYDLTHKVLVNGKTFTSSEELGMDKGEDYYDYSDEVVVGELDSGTKGTVQLELAKKDGTIIGRSKAVSFEVLSPVFSYNGVKAYGAWIDGDNPTNLPENIESIVSYQERVETNSGYDAELYKLATELWVVNSSGEKIKKIDSNSSLDSVNTFMVNKYEFDFTIPAADAKPGTQFKIFSALNRTGDNPKIEIPLTERASFRVAGEPTVEPTNKPTAQPTTEPTGEPSAQPTGEPTAEPTTEPTKEPSVVPSTEPTTQPTMEPSKESSAEPTKEPTAEPTKEASTQPTNQPTMEPSKDVVKEPAGKPSKQATDKATAKKTVKTTEKKTKALPKTGAQGGADAAIGITLLAGAAIFGVALRRIKH